MRVKLKCTASNAQGQVVGRINVSYYYESQHQEDLSYFLNLRDSRGFLYAPDVLQNSFGGSYLDEVANQDVFALVRCDGQRTFNGFDYVAYKLIAFTDQRGFDAFSCANNSSAPDARCQKFWAEIEKVQTQPVAQKPRQQSQQGKYKQQQSWSQQTQAPTDNTGDLPF